MAYPKAEETGACLTLYFAFCICVYGLLGFGFYQMLQPRHIANVGLASYKAPVAAVMGYDPTERFVYIRTIEDASYETSARTTVASGSNRVLAVTEAAHN